MRVYLKDDNGNIIDLPEDFQLFKSAMNLFTFDIKGNFSTTFQVPNNSFFKSGFNYFSPLQTPPGGFRATLFNLVREGNIIDRGQLILEREDQDFLYFFYVSGNSNWITLIPDISIKDIDYESYAIQFNVLAPVNNITNNSGFCFPIVDSGTKGKKYWSSYSVYWFYQQNFDSSNNFKTVVLDLYPCFYFKTMVSELFKYMGLKIGGTVLNDTVYNNMIITPDNGMVTRADKFFTDRQLYRYLSTNFDFTSGYILGDVQISWDSILTMGAAHMPSVAAYPLFQYVCDKNCQIEMELNFIFSQTMFARIQVYKNGSYFTSVKTPNALIYKTQDQINLGTPNVHPVFQAVPGDSYTFYIAIGYVNKGGWPSGGGWPTGGSQGDSYLISSTGTIGLPALAVNAGDIIQALVNSPGNTNSQWQIVKKSTGYKIMASSYIKIHPTKELNKYCTVVAPGDPYETIRASDILPDIKFIDVIKFFVQYFCAIPSFDSSTNTINFNKIDGYDFSNAIDISNYVQKYENNFQIQTGQYNYLRFKKDIEDPYLKTLAINNNLNYGDALIKGQSQTKIINEMFEVPFGAAYDNVNTNNVLMPLLNLWDLEPSGAPIAITSCTIGASGTNFNMQSGTPSLTYGNNMLCEIYGTGFYDGIMNVSVFASPNNYANQAQTPTVSNATGWIQFYNIKIKNKQSRLLVNCPSTNSSDYGALNGLGLVYYGYDTIGGYTTHQVGFGSQTAWAYFNKPQTSLPVSLNYKEGLAMDNFFVGMGGDIPRMQSNYKLLSRILNSPYIKAWCYLPESIFQQINFDRLIYIKDVNGQRYFVIDSIQNYTDSKTLCQINLLQL